MENVGKMGMKTLRNQKSLLMAFGKILLFLIILSLLIGCSAAQQAVKRGDDLAKIQNYYGASQEYFTALSLEPSHKEAKLKLCQFSKNAYETITGNKL